MARASSGTRPRSASTVASASGSTPSAAASAPSTTSSAGCPPSGSTSVRRSSGRTRTRVAPPGRTHHDSKAGSTGFRLGSRSIALRGRRRLLGRVLLRLREQLLGQLALAVGVELLDLVLDDAPVVALVPVVERV